MLKFYRCLAQGALIRSKSYDMASAEHVQSQGCDLKYTVYYQQCNHTALFKDGCKCLGISVNAVSGGSRVNITCPAGIPHGLYNNIMPTL